MESSNTDKAPFWFELEYYEGWLDTEGRSKIRRNKLEYHEFHDWLNMKGKFVCPVQKEHQAAFRILYSPLTQGPFKLGISANLFANLQQKFKLHEYTQHAFLDNNGAFAKFSKTTVGIPKKLKHLAMVLKVPNCVNIGYDALSLSYFPENQTTLAFYHGIQDWHRLLRLLDNKSYLCFHPLYFPTALYSCHRHLTGRYRNIIDMNLFKTEHQIGYALPGVLDEVRWEAARETIDASEVDYETIVKKLHSYQTEVATLSNVARFSRDCGDNLIEIMKDFELYYVHEDEEWWHETSQEIIHEIEFSRSLTRTLLSQVQSIQERVQSQTNLISSPDLTV